MSDSIQTDESEEETSGEIRPDPRDAIGEQLKPARDLERGIEPEEEEPEEENLVTLTVDGEDLEVTEDKIRDAGIRALQKESTADKRLREASELKREAEELKSQFETDDNLEQPSSDAEKLLDDLIYGENDQQVKAVETLLKPGADATSNEAIRQQVRIEIEFTDAVKKFSEDFNDVWTDPNLKAMALDQEKQMRDKGDDRPFGEVYTEIGNNIQKWVKGIKDPTGGGSKQDKKLNRKKSIDTLDSASAQSTNEQDETPKRKTLEETVMETRKARGINY